jgi:hypothetical protein
MKDENPFLRKSKFELKRLCLSKSLDIKDKCIDIYDCPIQALDQANKMCIKEFAILTKFKFKASELEIFPTEFGYIIQLVSNKKQLIYMKISELELVEI